MSGLFCLCYGINKIVYTQEIIKSVLKRSKLDRANVSYVNLYTFVKFDKLRAE